jgi:esterase/lipase
MTPYELDTPPNYSFNRTSIDRTVRTMTRLQRALDLNIRIHRPDGQIDDGDIYLFNHFARFETFIPQYLIYKQTGILSRSVAAAEFFNNPGLGRYLRGVGAVPNTLPGLLPFLGAEILRGRKVVIFPEGGMVKDRRVLDDQGQFSIYSRSTQTRRKHHAGAAVLAQMTDSFKAALLALAEDGDTLKTWADHLEMSSSDLLSAARRPTRLVPGNITFYPLRVDESAMYRATESLAKLNPRAAEELLIESNILLRHTDMDLRLGASILPHRGRSARWRRALLEQIRRVATINDFFALAAEHAADQETVVARRLHRQIDGLRGRSTPAIYAELTVNLSHLAASLMHLALRQGITEMPQARFHKALFLAIKALQRSDLVHLHRGLRSPERYAGLVEGSCVGFIDFIRMAEQTHALTREPVSYRFTEKLMDEMSLDLVRRENPVQVYANEAAPVAAVMEAAKQGLIESAGLDETSLAHLLFAEEQRALRWARAHYSQPDYADINNLETATASPEPYWLQSDGVKGRKMGVVLVHGLLASPAELAAFGEDIAKAGFSVLGVRLQGHGTSPWDLKETKWQDWLASVRRGIRIMAPFVERICLVGFSTGAALSLLAAAGHPNKLVAVAACSTPFKMRNRNLMVVPLVHSANELVRRLSSRGGLIMFRRNQSEHPEINYGNIPVSALNELRHMIDELDRSLPLIGLPCLILQGTDDQVVDSASAELIAAKLTATPWRRVVMIESKRHGILNEDIGESRGSILRFLESLCVE